MQFIWHGRAEPAVERRAQGRGGSFAAQCGSARLDRCALLGCALEDGAERGQAQRSRGMAQGEIQHDLGAHRMADQVRCVDAQMIQKRLELRRVGLERDAFERQALSPCPSRS
ncbi:hypothetical protein J7E62_00450 [Variovorax paradoxus]|nr:hypothetical protein [Variovorax paradoxus]